MGNGELNAVELEKEAVAPCIFLDGVLLARKISQKGDGVLPDSKIKGTVLLEGKPIAFRIK